MFIKMNISHGYGSEEIRDKIEMKRSNVISGELYTYKMNKKTPGSKGSWFYV